MRVGQIHAMFTISYTFNLCGECHNHNPVIGPVKNWTKIKLTYKINPNSFLKNKTLETNTSVLSECKKTQIFNYNKD